MRKPRRLTHANERERSGLEVQGPTFLPVFRRQHPTNKTIHGPAAYHCVSGCRAEVCCAGYGSSAVCISSRAVANFHSKGKYCAENQVLQIY
jgi:hypothetical protein